MNKTIICSLLLFAANLNAAPLVTSQSIGAGVPTLASTQTFSGANTFTGGVTFSGNVTGAGHTIASGTVSGALVGTTKGQLAQRTTLYFDTAGFEMYDDQASSATIVKSKGYQYIASTHTYPSGTTTSSTLGVCVGNSTATITTGNNHLMVCYGGGAGNGTSGEQALSILIDGAFPAGLSSTVPVFHWNTPAGNIAGPFCYKTPTAVSAGEHRVCLTAATQSGTLTIPGTTAGGFTSSGQLSVTELATGGSGFAAPASSKTVDLAGRTVTQSGVSYIVAVDTLTLNLSGAAVSVWCSGQIGGNGASQASGWSFLLDGQHPTGLSSSRGVAGGFMSSSSERVNVSGSYRFAAGAISAGSHTFAFMPGSGAGNTATLGGVSASTEKTAFVCGVDEIRNAPGTGDVSSNGNNSFSGANTFNGTSSLSTVTVTRDLTVLGTTYLELGSSTMTWTPGYCSYVSTTIVSDGYGVFSSSTNIGTSSTSFASITIPANYFHKPGMAISVDCVGRAINSSATNNLMTVYVGGNDIGNTTTTSNNLSSLWIQSRVIQDTPNTQKYATAHIMSGVTVRASDSQAGGTLNMQTNAPIQFICSGKNGTGTGYLNFTYMRVCAY